MSLSGLRSSSATSASRSNVFFAVRNFSFTSQRSPVIAWKNQPSDFFAPVISTIVRLFQFVGAKSPDVLDSSFDGVEDAAIPLAGPAVAADAALRVPAAAIDFPRHPRVAADVVDFQLVCRPVLRSRLGS